MMFRFLLLIFGLISFASRAGEGYFVRNKGQFPENVLYYSKLNYGSFFVEKDRFTVLLADPDQLDELFDHHKQANHNHENEHQRGFSKPKQSLLNKHAFSVEFKNSLGLEFGEEQSNLNFKISSFHGNDPSKWVGGLQPIQSTIIKNVYNKIDLKLSFKNNSVKYDFIVHPGGNTNEIIIKYNGLNTIVHSGNLLQLHTSVGIVEDTAPFSYSTIDSNKKLKTLFKKISENTFGLEVENHNPNQVLIIDPQLNFGTFSGSSSDNWGFSATYDDLGYAYGGGVSFNAGYPTSLGAFTSTFIGGEVDMTISKFSPDGSQLIASTYLGGNGNEAPHSMIVDSKGNLIVYGASSSNDFPTTATSYDNAFNGGSPTSAGYLNFSNGADIVLAKLSPDFTTLLGSTYYGGTGNDGINDGSKIIGLFRNYGDGNRGEVIVDGNDDILISSVTSSLDLPTDNGFQTIYGGGAQDGCVAKFDNNLSSLIWGSYYGGSGADACYSLKQNSIGETYISGGTTSPNLDKVSGAVKSTYSGSIDGFLARIAANGNTLLKTTYIGTSAYDQNYLVDVDKDDKVYCFGQSAGSMPVSAGVYNNPGSKQFLQKYNAQLTVFEKGTVFGNGSSATELVPTALMISDCKKIYASGWGGDFNDYRQQGTNGFPVTANAIQKSTDGSDFYVITLGKDFSSLNYGTFYGDLNTSEHVDGGTSRFDKKGTIYQSFCADCGGSSAFPVTPGAYAETNLSGSCNLALIKMDASTLTANIDFNRDSTYCNNSVIEFSNSSTGGETFKWIYPDNSEQIGDNGIYEFPDSGIYKVKLVAIDPSVCPFSDTSEVIVDIKLKIDVELSLQSFDCTNQTITLEANGPNDLNYLWGNENGTIPGNSNSITIDPQNNNDFFVKYNNGCDENKDDIKIPSLSIPIGKFTPSTFCQDEDAKYFFESYEVNSYQTLNNEPFDIFSSDSIYFPTIMDRTIYLETTSLCGNAIDTFEIDMVEIEPIFYPQSLICRGTKIELVTPSAVTADWFGNQFLNDTISNQTFTIFNNQSIPVELSKDGCSRLDTINLNLYPTEEQPIESSYTIHFGETVNASLNPFYDYTWSPRDYLSCSRCPSVLIDPMEDIVYKYSYTDTNGCYVLDSVDVNVIFPLYIPNTFTPNNDSKNDVFYAMSHQIDDFEMFIYNRWGQLVFHSENIFNGWDGRLNGIDQQIDVYVYKVIYTKSHMEKKFQQTGRVTLLR